MHGFPELAYSWRNQLRSYPAAGLRAIAPDMRGYGLTDRPAQVAGYAIPSLCADLVGLLDALDIERALFCGHDWGGAAVWTMPRLYPDRVLGIIGVNTPAFGGQPPRAPAEEPLIIRTENYYSTTFLEPGRAEAVFSRDVRRALEMILRPSSSDAMPSFVPDLERHVIADCGHWTQQKQPEEFDRVTLHWIRRKLQSA